MKNLKYAWKVLRSGAAGFDADNCFRYSAALSFYTLFSIAPIVLISIQVAGFFASDVDFQQEVTKTFEGFVGKEGAQGVEVLLQSLENQDQSTFQLIVGIVVLLFSATNIFIQMQGAFNDIFKVRPARGKGLLNQLISRLLSLGMILSLGFVMVVSLILDSVIVSLKTYLERHLEDITVYLITIAENLVLFGLVMLVVFALFRFLPDVRIKNKFAFKSSIFTTILLFLGKFGITWYISQSRFSELGGASASIIILMLWVYYSSLIVFFGAELIKGMSKASNVFMPATHYATRIKSVTVTRDDEDEGNS